MTAVPSKPKSELRGWLQSLPEIAKVPPVRYSDGVGVQVEAQRLEGRPCCNGSLVGGRQNDAGTAQRGLSTLPAAFSIPPRTLLHGLHSRGILSAATDPFFDHLFLAPASVM